MSGVSTMARAAGYPIRVFSTTGTAVSGGGEAGWITGTIASLAASGAATVQFDLGADWVFYPFIRLFILWAAPSSGTVNMQVHSADTAGATTRRIGPIDMDSINTTFLTVSSASGPQTIDLRPMGRYLTITATNNDGANAVGSTARIDVAQYPC